MKTAIEILQKSIYELKHIHGVTLQEATESSGVHNLQKIIDGKIEPTPNSWWKLHMAYPDFIPEPIYADGSRIYTRINAKGRSHAAGHDMHITNTKRRESDLTPEEQTLINILRAKDPARVGLMKLIAEWAAKEV